MKDPAPIDTPAEIGQARGMAPPPPESPHAEIKQAEPSSKRFRIGIDGTINITWIIGGILALAASGFGNVWTISAEATNIKGSIQTVLETNARIEAELQRRAVWMEKKDLATYELEKATTANREKISHIADGLAGMATGSDVALIRKDLASLGRDLDSIAARIAKLETR